jgi:tRNA (cytidine56-2'-O)-methyltransferase
MITVLRYGHRRLRDKRTTSHLGLVARAFGADRLVMTMSDDSATDTIEDVVDNWGGDFRVTVEKNWMRFLRDFKGVRVHLTMYGLPLGEVIGKIREGVKGKDLLVFVGAEKVPSEVYETCEFNVAVGGQPHSEIAALAVFLDQFFQGKELTRPFEGARLEVEPQARGKKVNTNP